MTYRARCTGRRTTRQRKPFWRPVRWSAPHVIDGDTPLNYPRALLMFGDAWPEIREDMRAGKPITGMCVVKSIDRVAGIITLEFGR